MKALAWAFVWSWLLGACGSAAPTIELPDLDGRAHAPLVVAPGRVHVVVFTSHECPIANAYAPTLRRLAAAWQATGRVGLYLVHVDPEFSADAARRHAADYGLPPTILLDPRHQLAAALGATTTPEAIVLTAQGIAYRGRIDDQWRALGTRAPAAQQQDLLRAVEAALEGRPVASPWPRAVGCLLPEPAR